MNEINQQNDLISSKKEDRDISFAVHFQPLPQTCTNVYKKSLLALSAPPLVRYAQDRTTPVPCP